MPIFAFVQSFAGTSGADHFVGGPGPDFFGMTADEFVTDTIDGQGGEDFVSYSRSAVGVDITLTDPVGRGGGAGGSVVADFTHTLINPLSHAALTLHHVQTVATLANIEDAAGSRFDDTLTGNSSANALFGGAGNDVVNGGRGDDYIVGGAGHDTLTGGAGADAFAFTSAADSIVGSGDVIADFERGADKIDLSGLVSANAGHHPFTLVGASFTGHAGDVAQTSVSAGVLVQADFNGDRHADFQLLVHSASALDLHSLLHGSDFVLS